MPPARLGGGHVFALRAFALRADIFTIGPSYANVLAMHF